MTKILILFTSLLILTSCVADHDNAILKNRNFDDGNWLIVINKAAQNTLYVIDDEKVLKENPFGLLLGPYANCSGTTCDGFLDLYKDGELIVEQEYLSNIDLIETQNILKAYKKAKQNCIYPKDEEEYKRQWDSLIKISNIYPTRYHTQPEDKDIICYYTYE